jgi:arsenite methyltransferase
VDAIISNCVINLSPDKDAVFHEAYRVLRPGGRLSVSDIVVDGTLPDAIRNKLEAWAECIAGALDEGVYLDKIRAAGFVGVEVVSRDYAAVGQLAESADAQALASQAGVPVQELARKIASVKVRAHKPA